MANAFQGLHKFPHMQRSILANIVFPAIFISVGFGTSSLPLEVYPVPAMDDKLLFYVQRNYNKNTIVYELNNLPNGSINVSKPVSEYWIRYEEGGVRKNLSFFQRKAFGLQGEQVDQIAESFVLHFNCYKKRSLYLQKKADKYRVYITINGEIAELNKLFIQCKNNALGIPLTINFVEISGINIKNGNAIIEKFVP